MDSGKGEDKQDRLATVLYNLVESITIGASLLESFMPETSEKILKELNTVNVNCHRWMNLAVIRPEIR